MDDPQLTRASGDGQAATLRQNPYVGPRPFHIGETLFGRDWEVRQLYNQMIADRIVLLHSPSGAGKTSLVQAGLLPLLQKEGFHVLPIIRVGAEPPAEIHPTDPFNRYLFNLLLALDSDLPEEQQSRRSLLARQSLQEYREAHPVSDDAPSQMLIFDQFEEIITVAPTDREGKLAFFDALGEMLHDRNLWVLFIIRDDFLGAIEPYAQSIPSQLANTFPLDFLDSEAALQAIQRPVESQAITFLDSAAQKLVDDLRMVQVQLPSGEMGKQLGIYVEPVQLQVVCLRLYEKLDMAHQLDKQEINDQDVSDLGDVNRALAQYYAERVSAIATQTGASERTIRDWFEASLITKSGLRGQLMMDSETSGGLDNRVIRLLEDAHLVRAEKRRGVTWVELVHDRMIHPILEDNDAWEKEYLSPLQRQSLEWSRQNQPERLLLRGKDLEQAETWASGHSQELNDIDLKFLDTSREWRDAHLSPLQRRALEWENQGRPDNLLLRGGELEQAVSWVNIHADEVTIRERDLLDASRQAAEQEARLHREKELKLQYELQIQFERQRAEDQAKTNVRLRRLTAVIAVALLAALILAAVSLSLFQQVQRSSHIVETQSAINFALSAENVTRAVQAENLAATSVVNAAAAQTQNALAVSLQSTAVAAAEEANTQRAAAEYNSKIAHNRELTALALSQVSINLDRALLFGLEAWREGNNYEAQDALLKALQFSPHLESTLFGHTDIVFSVAFSPDGKTLASGSGDDTIILWDVASRQPLGEPLQGHSNWVLSVAFSPDGKTLASGSGDDTIILWDVASRQPLGKPLRGHTSSVYSVAFSPDGKTLASGSSDNSIRLWDVASRQPLGKPLQGHAGSVYSVAFSPDGKTLASGSYDNTVRLWDVANRQSLGEPLQGHSSWVYSVAFSPDGKTLASGGGDRAIRLWDVASRQSLGEPLQGHSGILLSLAFSPDGQILASGSGDKTIILWDVASRQPLGEPLHGHSDFVNSVTFSPDGKTLASGSDDNTIRLWDVASHQALGEPGQGHSAWVSGVAFSPDGKTLASGGGDKTIILWDVASRQPLGEPLRGHTNSVFSVVFSPDGNRLASGSSDNTIRLWDVASRQPLGEPMRGHSDFVDSVVFSPDGKTLASGSYDNTIRLWDVASRQPLGEPLKEHTDRVFSVAFSQDGKTLASGSADNTIILWDVASRQPKGNPLRGHTNWVFSVAFSPDGKILASGSGDDTIILWDVASRQPLGEPMRGHMNSVRSLAFSPDGKTLASGSSDNTIRLWDVASRQPLGNPLQGHSDRVEGISFSPDGRTLASGSDDETVRLWDVDIQFMMERACRIVGRNFTQAEWGQYFPNEDYRKTCSNLPPGQ
jgi:WD40 repeat protein